MTILPGIGFLGAAYPWIKAAHIIFVIFLMAGLFMIPRCFVYHHQTQVGSAEDRAVFRMLLRSLAQRRRAASRSGSRPISMARSAQASCAL